jgi:HK97 gp10 family phage protein
MAYGGMTIRVKVEGLDKLFARIRALQKKMANSIMRKVLRAGAIELRNVARTYIKKDTGTLYKSMHIKVKAYRNTGVVVAVVGPRTKFVKQTAKGKRWASKYAHLYEFGRATFKQKDRVVVVKRGGTAFSYLRNGRLIRGVAGKKFMTRASKIAKARMAAAMIAKAKQELASA